MRLSINDFPVTKKIQVAWGEMDAFGHVNNCVFFRYFESSRIAYLDNMKLFDEPSSSLKPILARTSCKFISPIYFPDSLLVGAKVTKLSEDHYTMSYGIFQESTKKCMAIGDGTVFCFDYEKKQKVPLPESWSREITRIEKKNLSN